MLENFRTQKIIWDRANKNIFEKIEANSGDINGRKLVVQVINQEVTEGLSGTTLSLGWKSRKGAKGLDAFKVVDASKGIFEIYYTTEMLSNIGNIEVSLVLIDSTSRIESSTFTISVRPSTVDDESVESENSFTALTEALVKVSDLEGNYAPRLNEVTAQLAQTGQRIPNLANATTTLKVLNPYGNYQNIHAKVLHFPNGWNGFKYWMAYTPYPNGATTRENPCFAVSNNGFDWTLPTGVTSGLLEDWNGVTGDYNNDTHMVYRADLNRMEVWWRVAYNAGGMDLRRRTTTDGVNWTTTEIMFTGSRSANDHICPTIIFEDNKYKMLSVNTELGTRTLNYSESVDGKNWGTRTRTIVDWGGLTPWHMDFIKTEKGYEMVMQAWDVGEDNNSSSLYYQQSDNLITWTKPVKIISPTKIPNTFDEQGIYRSTLLLINGVYYVFYSSMNTTGQRALALSYGKNIMSLKGHSISIETLQELPLSRGSNGAILSPSSERNNTFDVKQSSNMERWGGLKLGNLLFADGLTNGVPPEDGAIRYRSGFKRHEVYNADTSSWETLAPLSRTLVWADKTTAQTLVNNDFITVDFNPRVNDGSFVNGTTVKIPITGNYKFTVGLQFTGLSDGDEVEVYVRRGTSNVRTLALQKVMATSDGRFFVNAVGVKDLMLNDEVVIGVKYIGASATAQISQYALQNFLQVERI